MPVLDNVTQRELLRLLAPRLGSEGERRALLQLALGLHCPVLSQLDFTGAAEIFILRLIEKLDAFGELEPGRQALWAVLETVREQVGVDRQARIDALQPLLNAPSPPTLTPLSTPIIGAVGTRPPSSPQPALTARPSPDKPSHPVDTGAPPTVAPLPLRIFLASPGDVADERALALKVLEQLPYDPLLRGRIAVETVAWDKPGAGTPMLATLTPQEAIRLGLPMPSECAIVIVIFWSRMGTPLPADWLKPDGSRYLSGTEWEYWDALQAAERHGSPDILVYRRTEEPPLRLSDLEREQKIEQWDLVEKFFQSFRNADGSIRQSYNPYAAPADFEQQLELHLRELIRRRLESHRPEAATAPPPTVPAPPAAVWPGSPFPGLRAFTPADAPIFFGRRRETDGLVTRLAEPDHHFVVVVGASGSGKSSLVAAGLIPRLQASALEGSQDWDWLRFTPGGAGDDPFRALAEAVVSKRTCSERGAYDELARQLRAGPEALAAVAEAVLQNRPAWAELLLFIDQFEELFTVIAPTQREPFIRLLDAAAQTRRLRLVATVRADFYARCVEFPVLAERLRTGSYPLAAPGLGALFEMITGPAGRAGLNFEDGLVSRILEDTGAKPGALALMAFALHELYEQRTQKGWITHTAYDSFQGVQGAIAQRAETVFSGLDIPTQAELNEVFRDLVEVDGRGVAARRRAALAQVQRTPAAAELVARFTDARLLVTSEGEDHQPRVEVAHEALLRSWPRLAEWIETVRGDLWQHRQLQLAVQEWETHGREPNYLWPSQRVLREVRGMLQRLHPPLSAAEQDFLGCPLEPEPMCAELDDPATAHERRALIGVRLALLGDTRKGVGRRTDGLPDIVWLHVPGGEITLEVEEKQSSSAAPLTFQVEPFYIAKYPVTYSQYRAFLEDPKGYRNPAWWRGLLISQPPAEVGKQFNQYDNHPAENVTWVEAIAFCRWLSDRLDYEVRLPTEWQWQQAATGGNPANVYPWGPYWDGGRSNTYDSGLQRSTAVGMYPHGVSPVGALDMSGNLWELCLNKFDNPRDTELGGDARRVVRGGSWHYDLAWARAASRLYDVPRRRNLGVGWRLACLSPLF